MQCVLDPEGSLSATMVVVLVVALSKMPKALLILNGNLRNLAYTFVTSFLPDLPSWIFWIHNGSLIATTVVVLVVTVFE